MLKCVAFDVGDTLTNHHHNKLPLLMYKVFKRYGYDLTPKEVKESRKDTGKQFLKKYYGSVKMHYSRHRFKMIMDYLSLKYNMKTLINMEKYYDKLRYKNTTLYPGVKSVIRYCKNNGLITTIVSNSSSKGIKKLLKKFGLDKLVDIVVISEEVGGEKSTMIPFKALIKKTKLKPDEILMVGNRPDEDMLAKRLGIKTCLIEYFKFKSVGPIGKHDFKINDIRELPRIIDRLMK